MVEVPGVDGSYAGILVGWKYLNTFGKVTQYGNDFFFNYNVEESSDWRWVMDQWVTVLMSKKIGLKVGLQWLYNNEPAFTVFPLLDSSLVPTGLVTPPVQLDKLDTIFSVSLVVNF